VQEVHYKPGDVNMEAPSTYYRVNRTLAGGTLERTYADGRKEKLDLKTGTTRYNGPSKGSGDTYTVKNIGKTDVVTFLVILE
jgi:hypothetical protein